ncbi:MAG: hypothetical protein UT24_C0003G0008 [Candidatus Woesebacteria bacterium GW2011_GWB1_39_12]|uniref:Uncharacterized protein n=1 Tax=Candidatus Woesebacteria bacterium GW2011_GWB1_39_12 TaxID=1618574 RepID=A0A0G0MMH6_9BACT|nr:MAG: hypothetical protein UT24_C0003G0008 [Candidatus Woesebacteria bacterium GW2011_GWB1_39_12]
MEIKGDITTPVHNPTVITIEEAGLESLEIIIHSVPFPSEKYGQVAKPVTLNVQRAEFLRISKVLGR